LKKALFLCFEKAPPSLRCIYFIFWGGDKKASALPIFLFLKKKNYFKRTFCQQKVSTNNDVFLSVPQLLYYLLYHYYYFTTNIPNILPTKGFYQQ